MAEITYYVKQHYEKAKQRGWIPFFIAAGKKYNFEPALLMAIASRETNMSNILGDHRYNARLGRIVWNGYGIMQVDINTDETWCLSGKWKNVDEAIMHGTHILDGKRNELQAEWQGERTLEQFTWVLAASYNHGSVGSYKDFKEHGSPDLHTTGGHYGHDVVERMHQMQQLLDADGVDIDDESTHPQAVPDEQPIHNVLSDQQQPAPPTSAVDDTPPVIPVAGGGANDAQIPVAPVMTNKDGSRKSWIAAISAAVLAALTWLVNNLETAYNTAKNAFSDNPMGTLVVVCFFAAIIVIYWKYLDRQTQLDIQREQHAHEQTLINQQIVADPQKINAVVKPAVTN
jgi:hypothetical protein